MILDILLQLACLLACLLTYLLECDIESSISCVFVSGFFLIFNSAIDDRYHNKQTEHPWLQSDGCRMQVESFRIPVGHKSTSNRRQADTLSGVKSPHAVRLFMAKLPGIDR